MDFNVLAEGFFVSIIGISVVLVILTFIALSLNVLRILTADKKVSVPETKNDLVSNEPEIDSEERFEDDLELVAVISAVIASDMNTTTDRLVVHSIRKATSWNKEAINEQQNNGIF